MMQFKRLEHRFCTNIPESLEPGVLYVSMEYATAVHSCCCGCGKEVVTPFTPTDWKMTFDGQAISLWPSVGNWTLLCRSHYVVKDGIVIEARPWSDEEIVAERRRNRTAKVRHYGTAARSEIDERMSVVAYDGPGKTSLWLRLGNWMSNRIWKR